MAEQHLPGTSADVAKYARAISFFTQQFPAAEAKVDASKLPFEDASERYADCIKSPSRDPTEVRARMKKVRDCDSLLAAAKAHVAGIKSRIDANVRNIALTRCNSVCAQVMKDLPSDVRSQIYGDCIGWLKDYDKCDLVSETAFYHGRFTGRLITTVRVSAVPLVNYWLKDYPSKGSSEAMMEWLGGTFASEMVAEWYRQEDFFFYEPPAGHIQSLLQSDTIWGTQLVPHQLVRSAEIVFRTAQVNFAGSFRGIRGDHNAPAISNEARYSFEDLAVLEPELLFLRPETSLTIDLWDNNAVGPRSMDRFVQALDVVARRLLSHGDAITFKLHIPFIRLTMKDYSIEDLRLQCEKIGEIERHLGTIWI